MTELQPDLRTMKVRILQRMVVGSKPADAGSIHEIDRAEAEYLLKWNLAEPVEEEVRG